MRDEYSISDDFRGTNNPLIDDNGLAVGGAGNRDSARPEIGNGYLTTAEASRYLRKSVSWLVRRNDIPYLKGTPNIYKRRDLDAWFDRNKFVPLLN